MNYNVPYSFILSFFFPVRPVIKKMLGCYGLFVNKKLVVLLRERDNQPEFNGVFIATQPEYFDELSNELHSSNMDFDIDGAEYTWIFISEDLEDFKDKVKRAAELIKNGDQRIGK